MTPSRLPLLRLAIVIAAAPALAIGQAGDEAPPRFTASALLAANVLKGPHHTVQEAVTTDGFYHEFQIASDFGQLEAVGLSQLTTRLNEVRALAALDEVSKSEVFLRSAGGAALNVAKSTARVATDPVGTARGIGSGAKRMGVNLGRRTQRAVSSIGNDTTAAAPKENAAEGTANSVLGVTSAMRQWARKIGADPYTTNPVLLQALRDIGRIDAAASIVTKVVIPIPAIVSTSASVGDLVWGKDPEELRKINEDRLKALGVSQADATRFFENRGYTLTSQTRFITALDAVKAKGLVDYVNAAAEASGERQALFFVESAEMLERAHAASPVSAVLEDSRALVARQGSTAVALLPLDYVTSTAQTRGVITEISGRVKKEFSATRIEAWLTGQTSARLRTEVTGLGWVVSVKQPLR
jgi:hypothetical protein